MTIAKKKNSTSAEKIQKPNKNDEEMFFELLNRMATTNLKTSQEPTKHKLR